MQYGPLQQTPREGSSLLNARVPNNGPGQYINTGWRRRVGEGKTTGRREIFVLGIFNGQLNAYDKNVCAARIAAAACECVHIVAKRIPRPKL